LAIKESIENLDHIWWDGLIGAWQECCNSIDTPDPIAGNHAWPSEGIIEPAKESDTIGDIYVNYETKLQSLSSLER